MARLQHPITIDWQRAETILSLLLERLERHEYPYNRTDAVLPQDPSNLPSSLPRGGQDEAMFLFTCCYYMRGGIDSVTAVRSLAKLYEASRMSFVAEVAQRADLETLESLLRTHGLQYKAAEVARIWIENARRLTARYRGDPRRIFDGISTYEEACRRIQNDKKGEGFLGFQKKMVSMLTYFLMDAGLVDHSAFPIPVDLHVMRVFVANEIVQVDGAGIGDDLLGDDQLPEVIREITLHFAREHGQDPLRIADALWLLSNVLCAQNPGNLSTSGKYAARSTELTERLIDWENETQLKAYERSCGSCVLDERGLCRWNVPSAPYYRWGILVRRGERKVPPQRALLMRHT